MIPVEQFFFAIGSLYSTIRALGINTFFALEYVYNVRSIYVCNITRLHGVWTAPLEDAKEVAQAERPKATLILSSRV